MPNLNRVTIIGNVGKNPEMRYTPAGKAVVTFSVAVNNSYTSKDGERREETEWFNVVAWEKLAETISQYVMKGMSIYVEGQQKTHSYEKDGVKIYRTELIARQVQFLSKIISPAAGEDTPEEMPF